MESMNELEALVAIWQQSGDSHANLWRFYIVVILGVSGFCLTDTYTRVSALARRCLVVFWLGFMGVNAWSIWDNLAVYNSATSQLQALSATKEVLKPVTESIGEIHAVHLLFVHGVFDVCSLAVVLVRGHR